MLPILNPRVSSLRRSKDIRLDSEKSVNQEVPPCKKVLFLNDSAVLTNTDWNGYSILREQLAVLGLGAEEFFPPEITPALLADYDVVVFSLSWLNSGFGQREITVDEANALTDFVYQGKGLAAGGRNGACCLVRGLE